MSGHPTDDGPGHMPDHPADHHPGHHPDEHLGLPDHGHHPYEDPLHHDLTDHEHPAAHELDHPHVEDTHAPLHGWEPPAPLDEWADHPPAPSFLVDSFANPLGDLPLPVSAAPHHIHDERDFTHLWGDQEHPPAPVGLDFQSLGHEAPPTNDARLTELWHELVPGEPAPTGAHLAEELASRVYDPALASAIRLLGTPW